MTHPMVSRLSEEDQRRVDDSWTNMFSPPDRLDRTLLLDVLVTHQMHQLGIDRLTMVSEKSIGTHRAVMTIHFDRRSPGFDQFTIALIDEQGRELRRERYTPDEIFGRLAYLFGNDCRLREEVSDTQPEGVGPAVDEQAAADDHRPNCDEVKARVREIVAATRPAGAVLDDDFE
jgi:hypothetical protein